MEGSSWMGTHSGLCPGQLPPQGHHQQAQHHRHREIGAETPNCGKVTKGDSTETPLTAAHEQVPKRWVGTRRPSGVLLFSPTLEAFGTGKSHCHLFFPYLRPNKTLWLFWEPKTTTRSTDSLC